MHSETPLIVVLNAIFELSQESRPPSERQLEIRLGCTQKQLTSALRQLRARGLVQSGAAPRLSFVGLAVAAASQAEARRFRRERLFSRAA